MKTVDNLSATASPRGGVESSVMGIRSTVTHVDIKGYFDAIPHDRLMALVREHIADGKILGRDHQRWPLIILQNRAFFLAEILKKGLKLNCEKRAIISLGISAGNPAWKFPDRRTFAAFQAQFFLERQGNLNLPLSAARNPYPSKSVPPHLSFCKDMKTITGHNIICAITLIGMLICTSCTSMIMQEGERPWALRGAAKTQVDSTYGSPRFYGKRFPHLDIEIRRNAGAYPSCMSYSSYGVYDIKGPFPENDVTVSLEALYFSVFTLGAAEIFMFPSTLMERSYQSTQTKPFLFLFNTDKQTLYVDHASEDAINLIEKRIKIQCEH